MNYTSKSHESIIGLISVVIISAVAEKLGHTNNHTYNVNHKMIIALSKLHSVLHYTYILCRLTSKLIEHQVNCGETYVYYCPRSWFLFHLKISFLFVLKYTALT